MVINDATIYNDGVSIGHECEEKIRQIMTTLKALSPASNLSMRFLKTGTQYEALIWGKANELPIGVYKRGPSLAYVLDNAYENVKKQCLKAWKASGGIKSKFSTDHDRHLAMAG